MEGEFLIIAGIRSQAGLFTGRGVNHFRSLVKRKLEKIVHWKWDSGKQPKFWLNRGKLLRKLQSCYDQPLRVLELREEGTIRLVRTHKNRDFVALPPPFTIFSLPPPLEGNTTVKRFIYFFPYMKYV